MNVKQLALRASLYGGLVLAGVGLGYGVMNWPWRTAPAGSPAAETQLGGPVIAGVCVLSRQAVFDASQVGRVANEKYKALRDAAQGQVTAEQTKIVADAKALEAGKTSISPAEYQQRQQDLAKRLQVLRLEASQDSRDLEATRQDIVVRISKEAQPVIAQIYKTRGCGLLVSRDTIMASNPVMDVTAAVVASLDAKITTVEVERKHITGAQNQQ